MRHAEAACKPCDSRARLGTHGASRAEAEERPPLGQRQHQAAECRATAQERARTDRPREGSGPGTAAPQGSQDRESPLGRLAAKWKLRTEIIDAGLQYGRKVRLWQANSGIPVEIHVPSEGNRGAEIDAATMRRWNSEIVRIDKALKEISAAGFDAVRTIAVPEREIAPGVEEAAVACLTELAIQLSMLRRVAPPAKPPTQRRDEAPQSEAAPDKFIAEAIKV
jgi:hypothetical protein